MKSTLVRFAKIKTYVSTIAVTTLLYACIDIGPGQEYGPHHFVDAEITSVAKLSDTSVLVNIDVYRNSSAWKCQFLIYGTYADFDPATQTQATVTTDTISVACDLERHYEVVIDGLTKGTRYAFQMDSRGSFDWGDGPGKDLSEFVGKSWEYTIP